VSAQSLVSVRSFREKLGLCQWFQFEDRHLLSDTIADLAELNIRYLRTGISWADYHRPGGRSWYDYQMASLADADLSVLVSLWHTPPSLSESGSCSAPPKRLLDYSDFVAEVIERYAGQFEYLELWNEPNNRLKWNFPVYDPDWSKFSEMIAAAAYWAKHLGQKTVLGGMMPVDESWLQILAHRGVLEYIDVVGIHGFPGMWNTQSYWWDWPEHWFGWEEKLNKIRLSAQGLPIWITEAGFATCKGNSREPGGFSEQSERLLEAAEASAGRVYWYCVRDLSYDYPCIEMTEDRGRLDHREYHLGLTTADGKRKLAWHTFREFLCQQPALMVV
jgi:CDP-paratose 2-epimerase